MPVCQALAHDDNLTSLAAARSSLADDTRAQAYAQAQMRGVPVDPRLALSPEEMLSNSMTTGGFNLDPTQRFDYSQDVDSEFRYQQQRRLLPGLVAGGVISESRARVLNNQDPEELNESLGKLTVDAPDGLKTLPGDKVNFLTGEVIPDSRYTN